MKLARLSDIVRDMAPALQEFRPFGDGVIDARIQESHLHDHVELLVAHRLFSRREMDDGSWKRLAGPRLDLALLIERDGQTAKQERMQRRQLAARGRDARAAKPRKVI